MPVSGQPSIGSSDILLKLIAQQWTEVAHQYVVVNTSRALAMLTEGQEACFSPSIITPEREQIFYVAPTHFVIPLQLIVRSDVLPRLPKNKAGEVVIAKLFDSATLRGLIVKDRSYSPSIDEQMNLRSGKVPIEYAVLADGGANIFKMIGLNRADYTFDYDFALAYQQQRDPAFFQQHSLQSVPIAGANSFVSGIACPRTKWGRETILKIDAIVAKLAASKAYQQASARWLTDGTIKRYKAQRAAFYLNRTKPTPSKKFE
jgi:uncharacterized protein (TIGR02285 family)